MRDSIIKTVDLLFPPPSPKDLLALTPATVVCPRLGHFLTRDEKRWPLSWPGCADTADDPLAPSTPNQGAAAQASADEGVAPFSFADLNDGGDEDDESNDSEQACGTRTVAAVLADTASASALARTLSAGGRIEHPGAADAFFDDDDDDEARALRPVAPLPVSVEDPVETWRDLGRSLTAENARRLRAELVRATDLLRSAIELDERRAAAIRTRAGAAIASAPSTKEAETGSQPASGDMLPDPCAVLAFLFETRQESRLRRRKAALPTEQPVTLISQVEVPRKRIEHIDVSEEDSRQKRERSHSPKGHSNATTANTEGGSLFSEYDDDS